MIHLSRELENRLRRRFARLYGKEAAPEMLQRFRMMLGRASRVFEPTGKGRH